jgi:histidinol-phosphate aminotransferase
MSLITRLARPELLELEGYRSAAWTPGYTRLHANENPWRAVGDTTLAGLSRYPEPVPTEVQTTLAALYDVPAQCLLATRGADEGIDVLCRAVLRAGHDSVLICPPTFGMYRVAAQIQGASVIEVPLDPSAHFGLNRAAIIEALSDPNVRLVFLCSPGNPTGLDLPTADVEAVLTATRERALVVVDEAYVEFAGRPSWTTRLDTYPHLVVLRTLSKAYSLAGARVGSVIAAPAIVELLGKLLPPYSMSTGTIESTLSALTPDAVALAHTRIAQLIRERAYLGRGLRELPCVVMVSPSHANFLLVTVRDPAAVLQCATDNGFLLRDYSAGLNTRNAIRITVGDRSTNDRLLKALSAL